MREIKYIILHCTAGPQTQKVSDIQAYWKNKLGWGRPGYHRLISPDGTVNELQDISLPTNGVAGYNQHSIHISYIGGVSPDGKPVDNRTDAQKKKMAELVYDFHKQFPNAKIMGHRDFSPDKNRDGIVQPNEWMKSCPSFSVKEWLQTNDILKDGSIPVLPTVKKLVSTANPNSLVNIRKSPTVNGQQIGQVRSGTPVIVSNTNKTTTGESWSFVTVSDALSGWIRSDFIK